MLKAYSKVVNQYPPIPLKHERKLIREAQKGSKKSRDELVLRHIKFLTGRIRKMVFPKLLQRYGDDLLADAILIVHNKIESYDLDYKDKKGNPNPVKFTSYIWKRVDGFLLDFLRKEVYAPVSHPEGWKAKGRLS